MVFKNGVKSMQAAAYNGARTVYWFLAICQNCRFGLFNQDDGMGENKKQKFRA